MQYNEEGLCASQVALLNNSVIESSFMLYDGDKIITYDIEGKLRAITETVLCLTGQVQDRRMTQRKES